MASFFHIYLFQINCHPVERIFRIVVFFLKNFSINRVIWFSQVIEKFLFLLSVSWLLSPILFTHEIVMSILQYSTSSTLYYKQIDLFFHCRNMWILNSETMAQTRNSHWKTFRTCTKGNNQDIMFPFLTLIFAIFLALSSSSILTISPELVISYYFIHFYRAKKLGEKLSGYKLGSDSNFLERLRKNLFSEYLSSYIKWVPLNSKLDRFLFHSQWRECIVTVLLY